MYGKVTIRGGATTRAQAARAAKRASKNPKRVAGQCNSKTKMTGNGERCVMNQKTGRLQRKCARSKQTKRCLAPCKPGQRRSKKTLRCSKASMKQYKADRESARRSRIARAKMARKNRAPLPRSALRGRTQSRKVSRKTSTKKKPKQVRKPGPGMSRVRRRRSNRKPASPKKSASPPKTPANKPKRQSVAPRRSARVAAMNPRRSKRIAAQGN